jgi:hypothetical protein
MDLVAVLDLGLWLRRVVVNRVALRALVGGGQLAWGADRAILLVCVYPKQALVLLLLDKVRHHPDLALRLFS